MITLANPLGLLALLGIPAVLAIHFLQRKAIQLPVSTLFLLGKTQRDAASGCRLDRIIPSVPLWMQLLTILLLTWILAEPRWKKDGSVQRIAVVLDSSASMTVFKTEAIARLTAALPAMRGPASAIELTVLESAPERPRIFTGSSVDEMRASLERWQPLAGVSDPTSSLRLARSLVSRDGTVIYLTDTPATSLPFEARLLAVGAPIENVGFTGVTFSNENQTPVWHALVRNYGKLPAEREWSLVTATGSTEPRPFRLEPGALVTLQSAFPTDAKNVRITLTADRFPLDDTLPLVLPRPKSLTLFATASPAFADLAQKLLRSLDSTTATTDPAAADVSIFSYNPLNPALPLGNSIVFVGDNNQTGAYLKGGILAEPNPLLDGLNWQSLLVRETIELDRSPSDTILLWQEKRPLIFLRAHDGKRQLCFNFDLRLSNAEKQPAFIVLLHRFAESIREAKIAPASAILETGQPLKVQSDPSLPVTTTVTDLSGKPMTARQPIDSAPLAPCFLTTTQKDTQLLSAAVYFADTREADFSSCATSADAESVTTSAIERHTRPDPFWRVWILAVLGALLVAWKFTSARDASRSKNSPEPIATP